MTRTLISLAGAVLMASSGLCAQRPGLRVTRLGAARSFGPGIVEATYAELKFELSREAHVIVLQVDPNGGITPLFPMDSGGLRPSGVQVVTAPAPTALTGNEPRISDPVLQTAAELARSGRSVRPPAVSVGEEAPIVVYWLVIVSDIATSAQELRAQLEAMTLNYRSVDDELRALPGALVGKRGKGWGAYFTGVQ